MTKGIETVIAEVEARLEQTEGLTVEECLALYPDHADELREVLPTIVLIHRAKRARVLAKRTLDRTVDLWRQAMEEPDVPEGTVGALFQEEVTRHGGSVEEYAKKTRLSSDVIRSLLQDTTPIDEMENLLTVRKVAQRWSAPPMTLLDEFCQLMALRRSLGGEAQPLLTRDRSTSSNQEQQALMRRVLDAKGRSSGGDDKGSKGS